MSPGRAGPRTRVSPRVTIGLPVRNGGAFLQDALDSLLAQTFPDFELIIGDNASTDATEAICRDAVARDARVRYIRHGKNLGAAANYNATFQLASSEYFRWAAHDDIWHPEHLERSVAALDADPTAVLSFTGAVDIDAEGTRGNRWEFPRELGADDPATRFRAITMQRETLQIFGLVRANVFATTALHEHYTNCDRVLLAELALHGPFRHVEGDLFFHREHPGRARRAARNRQERLQWYDTSRRGRWYAPEWLWLYGYARAIRRVPLDPRTRARCWRALLPHVRRRGKHLAVDLAGGARGAVRTLRPTTNGVGSPA